MTEVILPVENSNPGFPEHRAATLSLS